MKLSVNITSQGRMLDASLFLPDPVSEKPSTALLFEGSITGATNQISEYIATEICKQGFICLLLDHSFYGEDETAAQPSESPSKRIEDIKNAFRLLSEHPSVNPEHIIGVGVSVGAEFLAQACRESTLCHGLVLLQGPFDDAQNRVKDLTIPSIVIDETHLDTAIDEIVLWAKTVFNGNLPEEETSEKIDWSRSDK